MNEKKTSDPKIPNVNDLKSHVVNIDTKIPTIPKNESVHIVDESGQLKRMLHEPDETYDVAFCCGGRTTSCDKGLLDWFAKTCVSFSVLTFCFVSLINNQGDSAFLSSTISLILGTYLGSQISPPQKKDNNK